MVQNERVACINGEICPESQIRISFSDRRFKYVGY